MIRSLWRVLQEERLYALLKPGILLAVPLLAYLLGQRATSRLLALAMLGLGAIVALVVLTRRPEWGLLALILISFLVRWEIGTGTKVSLNATILFIPFLLGVWVLRMVVMEGEIRLAPSRVNVPALGFALATTVSLVAGNLRWVYFADPSSLLAQLGGWALYVLSMGIFLLVGNQIREARWLRRLTWLFIILGGVYIVGRVFDSLPILKLFVPASAGCMFWTWLAALAFGQFLLNRDLHPGWRLLMGLLVAMALYVGWAQGKEWIAGWLPSLIAVTAVIWLRSWRWGLAFVIVAGIVLLRQYPTLYVQVATPAQQYSTLSRAATWPIMFELIKTSPILGLGPSNYYHYTPLYPIWGWYVEFNSHNNYVDIVAQTGLVGLGLFVWLVAAIGRLGWRLRKRVQDGFGRGYVYGALGGLVGMLASGFMVDWFLPFVYNIGFPGFRASIFAWIFLGGLISLERIANRQQSQCE